MIFLSLVSPNVGSIVLVLCCWPGHRMLVRGVTGLSFIISLPCFLVRVSAFVISPFAHKSPELLDESVGFPDVPQVLRIERQVVRRLCCCVSPGTGCSRSLARSDNVSFAHTATRSSICPRFLLRSLLWWLGLL